MTMPDDPCPLCSADAPTRRALLAVQGEALDWSTRLFSIECSERWARGASERADEDGRDDLAAKLRGCKSGLAHGGDAIRALIRTRARVAEVEAERDAARVDLVWHEQMNGTRAEQEAHDAEADAVDAAAEALTPEQLRAEMIEIGLDPDRVEREAEVSARLIVRCMQARDERDAARAEIEELRLTLAAELGKPEGAPSEGWSPDGDAWVKTGPDGRFHYVTANRTLCTHDQRRRLVARVAHPTKRAAMIAADKATT